MNLKYPSSILASEEVQVVPTKVLKVDLPSRRIISVIAHKGRTLREVLRPLLNKYGFKLEVVTVWGDGHPVDMDIAAMNAPSRLTLTSTSEGDDTVTQFNFNSTSGPGLSLVRELSFI